MGGESEPLLTHQKSRPFEEIHDLERIETLDIGNGKEYVLGTPFSEMTYYLENHYRDSILNDIYDTLKKVLKNELKKEILEELKKENNNH